VQFCIVEFSGVSMHELLLEPVVITDMRIVAKASIVVYHNQGTNEFFIDPNLPENPLFKLGNFKGAVGARGAIGETGAAGADGAAGAAGTKGETGEAGADGAAGATGAAGAKGETGAAGAVGAAGAAGAKGDTGAAGAKGDTGAAGAVGASGSIADICALSINIQRAGVVAGLEIQTINKAATFIGRVLRFTGSLELTSTATGTASVQINVGGLVLTFATLPIAITVQHFNFDVTVSIVSTTVAFAVVKQSIAGHGTNANVSQSDNTTQIGSYSANSASIVFKSPVTTLVKTKYSVIETL
jgi:hypothetical protein